MHESTAEQQSTVAAPLPPPLPQRRPRVREVSSRFMSPLVTSNSSVNPTPTHSENHHRSKSAQRRRDDQEPENIKPPHTTIRSSLDTPFQKSYLPSSCVNRRQNQNQNQQSQRSKQLFKDNGGAELKSRTISSSRPDTPTVMGTDRIIPSRFRQMNRSTAAITPAAKLLQEATFGFNDDSALVQRKIGKIATSSDNESNQQPRSCPNSPLWVNNNNNSNRSPVIGSARSSMSEATFLNNCEASKLACSRSLDLLATKMGALLPPTRPKSGTIDGRRTKKPPSQQEDLHSLKLMHNHYLQWRFANAKAEISMQAQKKDSEEKLFALGSKITNLRDVVEKKRIEVASLQRIRTLHTIIEGDMPYLDKWSDVEEDYSSSLTGMTQALLNTSLRLPLNGEVRADARELGEALNSAKKVMEMIELHVKSFMPKAEELDALSSELARVTGREKGLIEECGDLITKTHASQVNEWSLKGHLIQLDRAKACT